MSILFFFIERLSSPFEKNELNNCVKYFDKVVLITSDSSGIQIKDPKLEVRIISFNDYKTLNYSREIISYSPLFIKEFFSAIKYMFHPGLFLTNVSLFLRSVYLSGKILNIINEYGEKPGKIILYSFWFNQWANALAILSKNKRVPGTFICRAHGTDLFEGRVPVIKRIAFRNFHLKYLDKIFSVSKKGTDYIKNKYPAYENKIFTSYLGTGDRGENKLNKDSVFTIVSCAKIRNIKRIHLIPEILKHFTIPARWIHIGSEDVNDPSISLLHKNVSSLMEINKKIEIEFTGDLSNEEVMKLYSEKPVNLFLSVSETEGLPVSMMEAISFGIPVMSTDVGGCNEIVTKETGFLIPKDFDQKIAAEKILEFASSQKNSETFRKGIRQFWKENFEINKNFKYFVGSFENN